MDKEKLRKRLLDFAHSCNMTLGQMIFTSAGVVMLAASIHGYALTYIAVLAVAGWLAWTFRDDLRS